MKYIVGANKDYYTQRNNQTDPLGACNVTSMITALAYLDYDFPPHGYFSQPEDRLYNFILDNPDCIKYYDDFVKTNLWAKNIPPMQIHDVLNWCTNHFMGKKVTQFYGSLEIKKILSEVIEGRPVVISGTFPRSGKAPLGHIIVLVGYDTETKEVCYDDPYGKTYEWEKGRGKNIWVSWDLFIRDIKDLSDPNKKLAHVFYNQQKTS